MRFPKTATPRPRPSEPYATTEDRIQQAIEWLNQQKKVNIAAGARRFFVPEGRLRARWNGRPSKQDLIPGNRKLSVGQELAVCEYIDRLDEIGLPARDPMITACANSILRRSHVGEGKPPVVSECWTGRFLQRNPEYARRRQQKQESLRKLAAEDPDALLEWYKGFKDLCDLLGITARDIYNFDESGFRVGVIKDQFVITRYFDEVLTTGSDTNRESCTVSETISGDGESIPPMVILKAIVHQERWYMETPLEDGTLVATSPSGYSNDELTLEWLKHFDKFTKARSLGARRLLLLDGYGSHTTREFLQYCEDANISCYKLIPHTTHKCQPLDVKVFQPYKHYHAEAIDEATRTGCMDFNRLEFLNALPEIRRKTMKKSTILSAWKDAGLIPYNPDLVIAPLLSRNIKRYTPSPPRTPEPDSPDRHPVTIHSLERRAKYLQHPLSNPHSSTYKRALDSYIKASLAKAHFGEQAFEDLSRTTTAQKARQARADGSQRQLQKGGVLYVGDARASVKKSVEDDLKKAHTQYENKLALAARKVMAAQQKEWTTTRREILGIRILRKRLGKLLEKEIKKLDNMRNRRKRGLDRGSVPIPEAKVIQSIFDRRLWRSENIQDLRHDNELSLSHPFPPVRTTHGMRTLLRTRPLLIATAGAIRSGDRSHAPDIRGWERGVVSGRRVPSPPPTSPPNSPPPQSPPPPPKRTRRTPRTAAAKTAIKKSSKTAT